QGAGAGRVVASRQRGRIEIDPQVALGRRAALDLGDDAQARPSQGAREVARRRAGGRRGANLGQRSSGAAARKLAPLVLDDLLEDAHVLAAPACSLFRSAETRRIFSSWVLTWPLS